MAMWKNKMLMVIMIALAAGICCCADARQMQEGDAGMNTFDCLKIIAEDIPNDKQSPFWDGKTMTVIPDPLDSEGILDGRNGEYMYSRLKTKMLTVYSVDRDDLLAKKPSCDSEAYFSVASENRLLNIRLDETAYEDALKNHMDRVEKQLALPRSFTWQMTGVCECTLLETPDGRLMPGLRFIMPTENGGTKIFEYGGMGMYLDVEMEAQISAKRTLR